MPVPGCNAWPGPKRRREENWEGGMEWRNNRWSRRPAASSSGWRQLGQQWPYAQQWPQDQQWQDDDHQWSGQHWGHQGWSGPEQCNGGKQKTRLSETLSEMADMFKRNARHDTKAFRSDLRRKTKRPFEGDPDPAARRKTYQDMEDTMEELEQRHPGTKNAVRMGLSPGPRGPPSSSSSSSETESHQLVLRKKQFQLFQFKQLQLKQLQLQQLQLKQPQLQQLHIKQQGARTHQKWLMSLQPPLKTHLQAAHFPQSLLAPLLQAHLLVGLLVKWAVLQA